MVFRIPSQDIPLVDQRTGLINIDWYDKLKIMETLLSAPQKLVQFTRVLSVASGLQSVTGVGFVPRLIKFQTAIVGGGVWASDGWADGTSNACVENQANSSNFSQPGNAGIQRDIVAGNLQSFVLSSFDADGFTLSWTKVGTPTATATIFALCFR